MSRDDKWIAKKRGFSILGAKKSPIINLVIFLE